MENLKFSFFFSDKGIKDTTPKKELDLGELFRILQSEKLSDLTEELKHAESESLKEQLKAKLPYITPFGTFKTRNNESIKHYNNNLIAFDFDNLTSEEITEIKGIAKQSENVIYCSVSPRQKGLKLLALINHNFDIENHATSLKHHSKDILKILGLENFEPDPSQFILSQAMFLSYDPKAHFNLYPKATNKPFENYKPKKQPARKVCIESNSRIDKFLIGTLKKRIEFMASAKTGDRHNNILQSIKLIGYLKHYAPHLINEFYENLETAVCLMYGNEKLAIEHNAIETLKNVFEKATPQTLDKIEAIIYDFNLSKMAFHCFLDGVEYNNGKDEIKARYSKEFCFITWELDGYQLASYSIHDQRNNLVKIRLTGFPTKSKIERLNLFEDVNIYVNTNGEMLFNGEQWRGNDKNISVVTNPQTIEI